MENDKKNNKDIGFIILIITWCLALVGLIVSICFKSSKNTSKNASREFLGQNMRLANGDYNDTASFGLYNNGDGSFSSFNISDFTLNGATTITFNNDYRKIITVIDLERMLLQNGVPCLEFDLINNGSNSYQMHFLALTDDRLNSLNNDLSNLDEIIALGNPGFVNVGRPGHYQLSISNSSSLTHYKFHMLEGTTMTISDNMNLLVYAQARNTSSSNYLKGSFTFSNFVCSRSSFLTSYVNYGTYISNGNVDNAVQTAFEQGIVEADNRINTNSASYNKGYDDALSLSEDGSFSALVNSVVDVPLNVIYSLLNFNILGVNIWVLVTSILSVVIVIYIIKKIK